MSPAAVKGTGKTSFPARWVCILCLRGALVHRQGAVLTLWLRAAQIDTQQEPGQSAHPAGVFSPKGTESHPSISLFMKPFKAVVPGRELELCYTKAALQASCKTGWGGRTSLRNVQFSHEAETISDCVRAAAAPRLTQCMASDFLLSSCPGFPPPKGESPL